MVSRRGTQRACRTEGCPTLNPVQARGSKADLAARFPGCLMGLEPNQAGCALSGLPGPAHYLSSRGGGLVVGRPASHQCGTLASCRAESPTVVVSRSLATGGAGQGWVL